MPVSYVIDKKRRLVISTARDSVTFAEVNAHQNRLLSDPDFNPEFNQFLDGTGMTNWLLSFHEVGTAATRRLFSPTSKRAFVLPSPPSLGISRVFEGFNGMWQEATRIVVFYDIPSALRWLDLDGLTPR
jgi:hypothetical protein